MNLTEPQAGSDVGALTTRAVATLFVIVLAIGAVVSACWPKPAWAR